jgi:hypothetical protein
MRIIICLLLAVEIMYVHAAGRHAVCTHVKPQATGAAGIQYHKTRDTHYDGIHVTISHAPAALRTLHTSVVLEPQTRGPVTYTFTSSYPYESQNN